MFNCCFQLNLFLFGVVWFNYDVKTNFTLITNYWITDQPFTNEKTVKIPTKPVLATKGAVQLFDMCHILHGSWLSNDLHKRLGSQIDECNPLSNFWLKSEAGGGHLRGENGQKLPKSS